MDSEELQHLLEEAYEACMNEGDFDDEQLNMFIDKVLLLYNQEY